MSRKCDILYIHPSQTPEGVSSTKYACMPMGLIGILNNLRSKGYSVIGVNYAVEKTLNPDYTVDDTLNDVEYRVLLTDLHWYMHAYGAMHVAERSKHCRPEIPVVTGGYTGTIYGEEVIEKFPSVDYVVTGDSDLPMEMLIDHLLKGSTPLEQVPNLVYRKDGKVVRSADTWVQTSLDEIDFITADYFDHPDMVGYLTAGGVARRTTSRWICIARGCKFNCSYCCGANANMQALFNRCNILLRSPEKVADDFYRLEQQGICHVSVSHDFYMFGKEYYQAVFAQIRKRNIKPGLYLECFQLPSKEFVDDLLQTFDQDRLVLAFSPTTGNEQLRRENGKLFSNAALLEMIQYLQAKKVLFQLYYTMNPVGETAAQFNDTYIQMKYLHMVYGLSKNQIFYQRVVLDPLAGMRKHKAIKVEYNTFMDYYEHCKIPNTEYEVVGFDDGAEVSSQKKKELYDAIFG
jgi:radical SAM superfamily enzyme YgiQ (UPF0313 family)